MGEFSDPSYSDATLNAMKIWDVLVLQQLRAGLPKSRSLPDLHGPDRTFRGNLLLRPEHQGRAVYGRGGWRWLVASPGQREHLLYHERAI
jgi:hypothetical protein